MKKLVGLIGARGMVGSVLVKRMHEENDFDHCLVKCYSTSQVNEDAPSWSCESKLADALDIDDLKKCDVILTCQGGSYTEKVHGPLRSAGWKGVWIDAASTLRMNETSGLILDPINGEFIHDLYKGGCRDFIGSNCTVSLLILGLAGLFKNDLVEWASSMTYQAISGAGAGPMKELVSQMGHIYDHSQKHLSEHILDFDKSVASAMSASDLPQESIGRSLAGNLHPWIDTKLENGQSREEWKAMSEANKILNTKTNIPIDGTCVRVGSMRSHAQGVTIKLKQNTPINEINDMISSAHQWVNFVENDKEKTLNELTPAFTSGSLKISVGRVRKMNIGDDYLNVFTVGDQLLWGAAEPLRRFLRLYLEY
jgi:aspartate-semialdehyde dehydrogenase